MNLEALRQNAAMVLAAQPPGTRLISVVKAGGYGHGATEAARALLDAGSEMLAVASLAEAESLLEHIPSRRILVLGGLIPQHATAAARLGCALTCSGDEVARALSAAAAGGAPVPVHLKVDTGMGRYGCPAAEAADLARLIDRLPGLRLAGTYTHFASSESDAVRTAAQFALFESALAGFRVDPGLRHACNSGGALRHPEMALDAVRCGIALYGCEWPGARPVLSLRALVTHVKTVPRGAAVGYGSTWVATAPTRVATIAIGYADGVHRARSGRGAVLVAGRPAPLIGRVSMDSITVDVSLTPDVAVGDVATLIGRDGEEEITAEEVAGWSGTISYEVLCAIGPRVERRHSE